MTVLKVPMSDGMTEWQQDFDTDQTFVYTGDWGFAVPNLEHIRTWIDALRSGEYTQGKGRLKQKVSDTGKDVQHCCLGVACEISGVPTYRVKQGITAFGTFGDYSDVLLPPQAKDWIGSPHNDLEVYTPGNEHEMSLRGTLAKLNDAGATFKEIAGILERSFFPTKTQENR